MRIKRIDPKWIIYAQDGYFRMLNPYIPGTVTYLDFWMIHFAVENNITTYEIEKV